MMSFISSLRNWALEEQAEVDRSGGEPSVQSTPSIPIERIEDVASSTLASSSEPPLETDSSFWDKRISLAGKTIYSPSKDVTQSSLVITEGISQKIGRIREDCVPPEMLPAVFAPDEKKETNPEDDIDPLAKNEAITNQNLEDCKPILEAYTVLRLLDWAAGNTPLPGQEKDPMIYQQMVEQYIKTRSDIDPPSLWKIYEDKMLPEKSFSFSRMKAKLCYFLLYDTGIITKLIKALTDSILLGVREPLKTEQILEFIAQSVLIDAASYLEGIKQADIDYIERKGNEDQRGRDQDVFRDVQIDLNFPSRELDGFIHSSSLRAVERFFPEIPFCNLWEGHASHALQRVGRALSICINGILNWITRLLTGRVLLPFILQSVIRDFTANTPEKEYLFSNALYKFTATKLTNLRKKLNHPEESEVPPHSKEKTANLDMTKVDKISGLALEIFVLDPGKTGEELKEFIERSNLLEKKVRGNVQKGIEVAVKSSLNSLYESHMIEAGFANLLEVLKAALSAPPASFDAERGRLQQPTFDDLKRDLIRNERASKRASKNLFFDLVRHLIRDTMARDPKVSQKRLENTCSQSEKTVSETFFSAKKLITLIEHAAQSTDALFDQISRSREDSLREHNGKEEEKSLPPYTSPESAVRAIQNLCNEIQDLNHRITLETMVQKDSRLDDDAKRNLDAAFQPIREQLDRITDCLQILNQEEKLQYYCARSAQALWNLQKGLTKIDQFLRDGNASHLKETFEPLRRDLENAVQFARSLGLVPPTELEVLLNTYSKLLEQLEIVQEQDLIIRELSSLIDKERGQLVGQLIDSPHSEELRKRIIDILTRADIFGPSYPFSSMIDQMKDYKFREYQQSWDQEKFKAFILNQLKVTEKTLLTPLLEKKFSDWWEKHPRGRLFEKESWEIEKAALTREIPETHHPALHSILNQVEAFLTYDSILDLQWNYFCQQIRGEIEKREIYRGEALETYGQDESLVHFVKETKVLVIGKQREIYPKLRSAIENIQEEIKRTSLKVKLDKNHDPQNVLTGAVTVGGIVLSATAGAVFTSFLGLPLLVTSAAVAAGIGAAGHYYHPEKSALKEGVKHAGIGFGLSALGGIPGMLLSSAYAGYESGQDLIPNAQGFGDANVTDEVILPVYEHIMRESKSPRFRKALVISVLKRFSEYGRR